MTRLPKRYRGKVISKENLSDHFVSATVGIGDSDLTFKAGQYISVIVNSAQRRPYSISSPPNELKEFGRIELLVDTNPQGVGSKYFENARAGDEVEFLAPFGNFTIPKGIAGEVWFVGTGSGLAPLKSQVLDLINADYKGKLVLVYGTRFEKDIVFKDFFLDLSKRKNSFEYYSVISRPENSYEGRKGYVTDILNTLLREREPSLVSLCGFVGMMEAAQNLIKGANPQIPIIKEAYRK